MPQGLQIWNQNNDLVFDTNNRLGRVIYSGPARTSGIPNGVWTQVIPSNYPGTLWGIMLPTYTIDGSVASQAFWQVGTVNVGNGTNGGTAGQIYIAGNWYNSQTATTTDYPYQNDILIYGVF